MAINPVVNDINDRDNEYPASMMPVIFDSCGAKLLGTVFLANGPGPHPLLILLHGFPGNENNYDIAHAVRRLGFNVLVFHYRGSWGSSGNYSFSNCLEDFDNVFKKFSDSDFALNFRTDNSKIILAGHSLGGFIALKKLCEYSSINYAATFGGFNFGYFGKVVEQIPGAKEITLEGLSNGTELLTNVTPQILYDDILNSCNHWDLLDNSTCYENKNILLIGAKYDHVAPVELHYNLMLKKYSVIEAVNLENHLLETGHSFSDKRIQLTQIIVDWLNKIKF